MTSNELHRELAGRRILIVEDERLIALDMLDILERWGCTVLGPVGTAAAALEVVENDLPDGAILDVNLIGGTSEPVAEALAERGRPFIVVTAYERGQLTGSLRNGPMLRKPLDEAKLQRELSALFSSSVGTMPVR
ncbi:MAG: response regulator [Salinarimonas sp.]